MLMNLESWALSAVLIVLVVLSHDAILHCCVRMQRKLRMVAVMFLLFLSHCLHIWIYAIGYWVAVEKIGIGELSGALNGNFYDYVYFSGTSYSSLGYGDVTASGGLRDIATFECVIGLLMIGWSTAFAFWHMKRHSLSEKDDLL